VASLLLERFIIMSYLDKVPHSTGNSTPLRKPLYFERKIAVTCLCWIERTCLRKSGVGRIQDGCVREVSEATVHLRFPVVISASPENN